MKVPFQRSLRELMRISSLTWCQMRDAELGILAGSLAFATVISLIPLLAVSLSVFNAVGGLEKLLHETIEPFIFHNLIEASGAELSRWVRRSIERIHSGALGFWAIMGLLLASTKLFHDMESAVHKVWHLRTTRSFVRRVIVYWLVMFTAPLAGAAILGLWTSQDLSAVLGLPRRFLFLGSTFFALALIYKFVPSLVVRWRSALLSAAVATIGVTLTQEFYASVMKNILRYNKIYGSLASVPIFLIWILVLWWICLVGVALCAVLEKRETV